jgi:hypothetical protein
MSIANSFLQNRRPSSPKKLAEGIAAQTWYSVALGFLFCTFLAWVIDVVLGFTGWQTPWAGRREARRKERWLLEHNRTATNERAAA